MPSSIPDGRVFGLDQQTLISVGVHLFNLAVLAFMMSRLLYVPVRDFLYKRTARISEQFQRARDEKAEAEKLRLMHESSLQNVELERSEILTEAQKLASQQREALLAEAKSEAEALVAAAKEEIAQEKALLQTEMKQTILEVAAAMAEKYVVLSIDDAARERLFTQTIAELEDISWWE